MSTIILASSGSFTTGKNLNPYLPKKLTACRIAFIITASKKADRHNYMDMVRARLKRRKLTYTEIDIEGKTEKQLQKILAKYDIIMVNGGSTFYLLKHVQKSGFGNVVKKLLAKGVPYIGISAGSHIACPSIIMSTWHDEPRRRYGLKNIKAMGLVPFWVKAHHQPKLLPMLKQKFKKMPAPFYQITDQQAVVVKDDKIKIIGPGKKIIFGQNQKPRIIIVNEKDKVIGHKYREDVKLKDIYRVSALWGDKFTR